VVDTRHPKQADRRPRSELVALLGTFPRTQKRDHTQQQALLGVLIKKISVPRFQFYFFSPKPRFYFCELLWFWKWRRFLKFCPIKTISSRKSEVKAKWGTTVRFGNELIETSPTSHRNLCFRVANSKVQLQSRSSLSGSAARQQELLSLLKPPAFFCCKTVHFFCHMSCLPFFKPL
jgi:hypothetical protein